MKRLQTEPKADASLLARIGGPAAVSRVAQLLYAAVITDDLLSDYFQGTDLPELEKRQVSFLTSLLATPVGKANQSNSCAQPMLTKAHAHLVKRGLTDLHFERLLELMDASLREVKIDMPTRVEVRLHLNQQRTAVLGTTTQMNNQELSMFTRLFGMIYAIFCYSAAMASLLYTAGWLVGIGVPQALDSAPSNSFGLALLTNLALVFMFSVQHSVMARPWFKANWTKVIPPALERATYVLSSTIALMLLMWFWQPLGIEIWHLDGNAAILMYALYALGWVILVSATFYLNHFELFGLRQAWLQLRGLPYAPIAFATPGMYRWVRHPIYTGWLILIWAAPVMTISHLVFALAVSIYTLTAIRFEERDLRAALPEYQAYEAQVPALLPRLKSKA